MGGCSSKPKTVELDDKPHDLLSFDSKKEEQQKPQQQQQPLCSDLQLKRELQSLTQDGKVSQGIAPVPPSSKDQALPKKEQAQEARSLAAQNDGTQDQEQEQERKQAQVSELIPRPTGDPGHANKVEGDGEVDTPRLVEKLGDGPDNPEVALSKDDGHMYSEEACKHACQEDDAAAFKDSEQAEVLPAYQVKGEDDQAGNPLDIDSGKLAAASDDISPRRTYAQPPSQLQSVQEEHLANETDSSIARSLVDYSIVEAAYELPSSMPEDKDIRNAEAKGDSLVPSHSTEGERTVLLNGEPYVDTLTEGTKDSSLEVNGTDVVADVASSAKGNETTGGEPRNGTQSDEFLNNATKQDTSSISDHVGASQVTAPKENGKMEKESNPAIESMKKMTSPDIDQVLEKLASEFERQESLSSSKF